MDTFCLLAISSPCVALEVKQARIFGIPELISGIAFLSVPWTFMSAEAKLKLSMSFFGRNKHTQLAALLLFSIATIATDFLSISFIDENSYRQFYLQQFQIFLALIYATVFYFLIRVLFVDKVHITSKNAQILADEIRRINITDESHAHTSIIVLEGVDDIVAAAAPLSTADSSKFGTLIDLISSDVFVKFVAKNNPYLASRLSRSISTSNVNADVFDRFFSKLTHYIIKHNPHLIDDFRTQIPASNEQDSIIGEIYFNDRIVRQNRTILVVHGINDKTEIDRLRVIIFSVFDRFASVGILKSRSIFHGLIYLAAHMRRCNSDISPPIINEIRSINAKLGEKTLFDQMDIDHEDESIIIDAWAEFILASSMTLALQTEFDKSFIRIFFSEVLTYSIKKNTYGRLLTLSIIRSASGYFDKSNGISRDEKNSFREILNLGFPAKYPWRSRPNMAHSSLCRIWHRKNASLKDSI